MMKNRIVYSTAILLAGLILMGSCHKDSGDDEENIDNHYNYVNTDDAPDWQIDWSYNQARPDWQEPDYTSYEFSSVMLVKIEKELQPYVSEDDLMAIFIDDELRGLATPAISVDNENITTSFLLKAFGNEADKEKVYATIKYYNSRLHHIFTFYSSMLYNIEEVIGLTEDYVPFFTLGSSKYPIHMFKNLAETPLASTGITPSEGDLVGAFVGDECRGTAPLSTSPLFPETSLNGKDFSEIFMTIYGKEEGESVTIKYYDADQGRILIFNDVFTIKKIALEE